MQRQWFSSGHRKLRKRKDLLIKHNIPRYVDTICGNMKTFVTFMKRAITKKNTLLGTKLKLAFVIRTEMWPTSTPKNLKEGIIRLFIKENFNGSLHIQNTSGGAVYVQTCSGKSITPEPKRNRCMGQKSKTSFNNVTMLTFHRTILLMCMWTC